MAYSRITSGIIINQVLSDLNQQTQRLLKLQEQLSTGQSVNSPSDNPLAARRAIAAQARIAQNEQYLTNITTVTPFLADSETALNNVLSYIQRAQELTIQGANSTGDDTYRDTIADEINQIIEGVLQLANGTSGDRQLFGGTRTSSDPFEVTRDGDGNITSVTYSGNDKTIEAEISKGTMVGINITGEDAFTATSTTSVNIFQTLIDIRDNLRNDDVNALQDRLGELETAQDQVLSSISKLGSVQARLEDVTANLDDINVQLELVISDNIDADFAELAINLTAQSNAYQAALSAASNVIQPSLLDYLG